MLKIFLTGKTSFIGRNIFEHFSSLKYRYDICAPNHVDVDLTDERAVKDILTHGNYDVIIHAAMYNKDFNHPDMLSDSLRIFYNLEKCSSLFGRMYYFGSGAEFDKTRDIADITEEEFGRSIPRNYYGFAKYIMAKQALSSRNLYNLRLFAVYGRYEHWQTKFISNACCRAIFGMPVTLSQNTYFDYLYIDDLCAIVEQFIHITPRHHHYNIASGSRTDLYSLAQKVVKTSGKSLDIVVSEHGFKQEYTASNKRMLEEINCNLTGIDDGIKLLYDWYQDNMDLIDKDRL